MSNLIKSTHYISIEDKKMIEIQNQEQFNQFPSYEAEGIESEEHEKLVDQETIQLRDQILGDAEGRAEQIIEMAKQEAANLIAEAKQNIDEWWEQKRKADDDYVASIKAEALDAGYQDGLEEARNQMEQQYMDKIQEASNLLVFANKEKLKMIQEAEPFLVELSCGIAEKLLGHQLTIHPEWVLDMVKQVLSRKYESGTITLCVAPDQFPVIHEAKEELKLVIDSQAELVIIPDASIKDYGCVVRSSFGSVDARIDTQLSEIKNALLQVAAAAREET